MELAITLLLISFFQGNKVHFFKASVWQHACNNFNLSKLQFRKLQPFTMNPFIKDVTLFKNNSVSML